MNIVPIRAFGAALLFTAACTSTKTQQPQAKTSQPQGQVFYSGASADARIAAQDALQTALETKISGEEVSWVTSSREAGYLIPVETWRSTSGHWCRRFSETASFANMPDRSRTAVACRVDGRWQISTEA